MSLFQKIMTVKTLFFTGLFLKLLLGTFLASFFLTDLCAPFIDFFISSDFNNPYEHFVGSAAVAHFPYPALMLYIMALPKVLLGWALPDSTFTGLLLHRLPLLLADACIFLIMRSWLKQKFHIRLTWFYWLSPVLVYISYIHGQLDVIPIALLFGSLYYLFKDKYAYAAALLGCALATKTNVALVFPFYFLFLLTKDTPLPKLLAFFGLSVGIFLFANAPYLSDPAFLEMVFANQEQAKLYNAFVSFNSMVVFLIPSSFLILFILGALLKTYNRDIFIMFLGFSFSIVLLFIPPMPGWYFWLIPFLSYFYIKEEGRSFFLFLALQAAYLFYFLVIKDSDYLSVFKLVSNSTLVEQTVYGMLSSAGVDAERLINLAFTALQTTLLINCFWIYKRGLHNYSRHKITASPYLIGIGGNSGVGKTTISKTIEALFTPANTTVLRGDDMHKWQRGHKKWDELTHLDPKANHLHMEINFLKRLKKGRKILRRHYDHSVGTFTEEQTLSPNNIIIYEGLHPFYLSSQRALYDLKIFIKPSIDLMYHWKIIRDNEKRGYSKEKIVEYIKKREKDSKQYIETQLNKADIVIEIYPEEKIKNIGDKKELVNTCYKLTLSNDVYVEPLVDAYSNLSSLNITHEYIEEDHQTISIKGACKKEDLELIAQKYICGLDDLGINNPIWPQDLLGVLATFLIYYLFEKEEYDRE